MENSLRPEQRGRVLEKIRGFGADLADPPNSTVSSSVFMQAVWREDEGRLGYKLDRTGIPTSIPLQGPAGEPSCYLYLLFRLLLNEKGYLVVTKSALRLYLDEGDSALLLRYEYVRGDPGPYPDAHLHIEGEMGPWKELNERTGQKKGLGQLHFPVGGKRYRPSVEDFLEFLITEKYAKGHDGWEEAIEVYRSTYHRNQLGAAVHADPDYAADALREMGYKVRAPRRR